MAVVVVELQGLSLVRIKNPASMAFLSSLITPNPCSSETIPAEPVVSARAPTPNRRIF